MTMGIPKRPHWLFSSWGEGTSASIHKTPAVPSHVLEMIRRENEFPGGKDFLGYWRRSFESNPENPLRIWSHLDTLINFLRQSPSR